MKGKYEIKISNNKVGYTLLIERNVTILTGESGIGKSSLVRLIQNYEEYGKKSGVTVKCKKPCRTITSNQDWKDRINKIHNSIIFIDEGKEFLRSQEFAKAIDGSDNYFVLITREGLSQIPYSVDAILSLKETVHRNKRVYSKSYPCYAYLQDFKARISDIDLVITEDTNAGFQMYDAISKRHKKQCESAEGKSSIARKLDENNDARCLVIADGAAFGSEIRKIARYMEENPEMMELYLPESFEWLILKSGIINNTSVQKILINPSRYIDSSKYLSWERYFTELLINTSRGTILEYRKEKLNKAYLSTKNINKVIRAIENE